MDQNAGDGLLGDVHRRDRQRDSAFSAMVRDGGREPNPMADRNRRCCRSRIRADDGWHS